MPKSFFEKIISFVTNIYGKLLKVSLRNRAATIIISLCILVIALAFIPGMKITMMTGGRDESVRLSITMPIGTTFEETKKVVMRMEEIVNTELEGKKSVTTTIGGGGRNGNTNTGSIQIALPSSSEQIDSAQTMQNKLRRHFDEFPNATLSL